MECRLPAEGYLVVIKSRQWWACSAASSACLEEHRPSTGLLYCKVIKVCNAPVCRPIPSKPAVRNTVTRQAELKQLLLLPETIRLLALQETGCSKLNQLQTWLYMVSRSRYSLLCQCCWLRGRPWHCLECPFGILAFTASLAKMGHDA